MAHEKRGYLLEVLFLDPTTGNIGLQSKIR